MPDFEYVDPPGSVCLTCGQFVPLSELHCGRCGDRVDQPDSGEESRAATPRPDRGMWVQLAATASLLFPFVAPVPAFTAVAPPAKVSVLGATVSALLYVVGLALSVGALIVASAEYKGMGVGRVNPDGRARVICGGVLAGFTLLMQWCGIAFIVWTLF